MIARLFACLALLIAPMACGPAGAQTFPKFTGLVVDAANVLPPETRAALNTKLTALQRETKRQLVVATVPDTQGYPLEDYGYRLGRAWGVGLKDVDNGAILFVAPGNPVGQRGPRLEVGRGLEPVLTDAFASQVTRGQMTPLLKAGDISGAMTAGTDSIIAQLRASPDEAKARTDAAAAEFDRTHRRAAQGSGGVPISLIFFGIILAFVVLPMFRRRGAGGGPWGQRYSGGGGGMLPIMLWSIASGMGQSRGGGGGGGGWGGGSSDSGGGPSGGWGDDGFSGGGGGSFGGGGASGDW